MGKRRSNQRNDGRRGVELEENDEKTERENSLAHFSTLFSEKITIPNSEN
jgi:hypothetical protein